MNRLLLILCFALTGCQTTIDDTDPIDQIVDKDGDGVPFEEDCNDSNDTIYPGAPENCNEPLVDSNCDGFIGGIDADGDGFRACDDCDDGSVTAYPNAPEICDGQDNDCDGQIDDDDDDVDLSSIEILYLDADNDGYGDDNAEVVQCAPPENAREIGGDCNDSDPLVYPGATEICDFKDNDCNGDIDRNDENVDIAETDPVCFPDEDGDGHGDENASGLHTCFCEPDEADNATDCDDGDGAVRPDADFSETPAASGRWDLNCDGDEEQEHSLTDGYCSLSADGRTCKFSEGYTSNTLPDCGDYEVYIAGCIIKKGTTGPFCEATFKDQLQRCR